MGEPVRTDDQKDPLDIAVAIAQILAVVALPFIGLQLYLDGRAAKMQRTVELLQRWESRELADLHSRVVGFLYARDEADCVAKLVAWERMTYREASELPRTPAASGAPTPSKADVDHFCSFFEDLGLRYNQGRILREPVISGIANTAIDVFNGSTWLIHYWRGGRSAVEYPLYAEWQEMARDLRAGGRKDGTLLFWKRPATTTRAAQAYLRTLKPKPSIVICLPADPARASIREIELAKRLSLALRDEKVRDVLVAEAPRHAPGSRALRWQVIVVPSVIDDDSSAVARKAHKLALRLDQLEAHELNVVAASARTALRARD